MKFLPLSTALSLTVALVGCSSGPRNDPGKQNLEQLVQYYNQYTNDNKGQAPPSEDVFKKFLASKNAAADKLLVSPRDQQPYLVKYKGSVKLDYSKGLVTPDQAGNKTAIIEEQAGVSGKRLVAYNTGAIDEVSGPPPAK